MRRIRIRN